MFLLVSTFFLLASAIIANKFALTVLSPITLVAIRMLGGGCILLWQERSALKKIQFFILPLSVIAVCTTLINSLLKAYALQHLSSGKAALIAGLDPIVTALMAFFMLHERLNLRQMIAIAIAISGSIVLAHDGISDWNASIVLPSFAAFGAIAIGRYGWILASKLLKEAHLSPAQINAGMMVVSGSIAFTYLLFDLPFLINQLTTIKTLPIIGSIIYTTLIGNVLAYPLYTSLLRKYSPTLLALFGFLIPLFVIALSIPLLSETYSATHIIAGVIMFAGVALFFKSPE